jgi:hypothetical protein
MTPSFWRVPERRRSMCPALLGGLRFRVRANCAFLGRVTRFLATGAGIRRLLDIGTVIQEEPTSRAARPYCPIPYGSANPGPDAAAGPSPP